MQNFLKAISNKKFLIVAAFSVFLIVVLVTRVTLSLFFSSSDTYSTIVISDLDVTAEILNQSGGALNITTSDLIPGEIISRTLQITNAATSQDAYVRIQGVFQIDYGTGYEDSLAVQMQLASSQTGWLQGNSGPEYWFYYDDILTAGAVITVDLEFVVYPTEENSEYGLGNGDAGKPFKVTVTVNAVQEANDAYTGWSPDYPVGWPA